MRFQNPLLAHPVLSRTAFGSPRPLFWAGVGSALLVVLSAAGCGSDLGKCDPNDLNNARTVVVNGEGQAIYAGQAVLNDSCAAGRCHSSSAKGAARLGAPAGLDFDLEPAPVVPAGPGGMASVGLILDSVALSRLRSHQRIVFDEREEIWEQVDDGLMPPDGVGEAYRRVTLGRKPVVSGTTCARGTEEVSPIGTSSTKAILRQWLACGAPVVEASNAAIAASELRKSPAGIPGTVGQQMPFCESCDGPTTFGQIYDNVLEPSCVVCHNAKIKLGNLDLEGAEVAYDALTMTSGQTMNCKVPFVVPQKPEESYIIAKMGGSDISKLPLCGSPMPQGSPPLSCGLQQLARWIKDGAMGP